MQNPSTQKNKVYLKRIDDWTSKEKISEGLSSLWQQMDMSEFIQKDEFVAIKLTFGEEGTSGYIKSEWISRFIENLKQKTENLYILETNTLYREKRSNAVGHLHVANLHGYDIKTLGIPIIIGDGLQGRNSQDVAIRGEHLETVKLAKAVCESNAIISLSHITGHCQTGLAGSLKNLGMGCASRAGKLQQHSRTLPEINIEKCVGCGECMEVCPVNAIGLKKKKAILVKERCVGCGECTVVCQAGAIEIKYDENTIKLQEKMVEYTLGVTTAVGSKIVCINFLYNVTKNCDCMSRDETPIVPDVGIIGGFDPVAVDKASLDILGVATFKNIFPEIDPMIQILHGEKIKLGLSQYELIEV